MMIPFEISILPFVAALIFSLVLTPLTIWLFKKMDWVIDPKKSPHPAHIHQTPVPKGGGLPIFLSVLLVMIWLLPGQDKYVWAILAAGFLSLLVGLVDDVRGVSPYLRLGINILSSVIIVTAGIGVSFVSSPFGGVINFSWIVADLLVLLWLPTLMNAINWSSGVDGQISGVITIAALTLGGISMSYSADITQWPVAILAFSLAGAFLGLTVYHFYPQQIMPGYSATSLAGLWLGVVSILATAKVGALIMVLAVPLVDFTYLIIKRISQGKSPVWGGKEHLHHKLMSLGWGKRKIAVFYWGLAGTMGILALSMQPGLKMMAVIGLVIITFSWIWHYSGQLSNR